MKKIEKILQEKGLKKTPLRLAILEVFLEQKKPISIGILEALLLEKKISPNQTSLYRQIESLSESKILQPIVLKNSATHYELQTSHHHHFVCNTCDKIECVEDPELDAQINLLQEKLQEKGIDISSHQFSFNGTCSGC